MFPLKLFIGGVVFALCTVTAPSLSIQVLGWLVFFCTAMAAMFIGIMDYLAGKYVRR